MTRALSLSALLITLPLVGCGGSDDGLDGEIEETGEPGLFGRVGEVQDAVQQMQEAAERPPADPVDFRRLRDLLPESVAGLERTEMEGASQGAMGFSVSEASAVYQTEGEDGRIEIKLTDLGALPSAGMFGLGWTMADVDRETTTGYEKTVRLGENKGYREYDTERQGGEFSLLVADRFLIAVTGRNVEDTRLEEALRAVDLSALAGMRDEGRQAT